MEESSLTLTENLPVSPELFLITSYLGCQPVFNGFQTLGIQHPV
jgi:hypothetical protein